MKKMQQGFTLIELMIVVAIIGILAAIAIPAYQDYTKRAHVSEGLSLAAAAKTSLSEYYASNGGFLASGSTGGQVDNTTATNAFGLPQDTSITGNAVTQVTAKGTTASQATITITYNGKVASGASVVLTADTSNAGAIKWTCAAGSGAVAMDSKWLPSNCR